MQPQRFDVVVTTNMFGDIMADLAAGLGVAPAISAGPRRAMAQATHGSAPDIAGKGIANPYAEIMSMQMLLAWLARRRGDPKLAAAAQAIEAAAEEVIAARQPLTPDLGGSAGTRDMGAAIADLAAARVGRTGP